jgi:hypothetical protein
MVALVKSWRSIWNQGSDNPFGIVTLASSGSEGGRDMGTMRWSQTANYGVLPNPSLPNTFSAQAYDLDDPWMNTTCYNQGCCPNNYNPKGSCDGCWGPNNYCANLSATNYYMVRFLFLFSLCISMRTHTNHLHSSGSDPSPRQTPRGCSARTFCMVTSIQW